MKALIFDVDDTLYDLEEPLRKTFNDYYRDVYHIDINLLFQYVRKYSDQIFDASMDGTITMDDMYVYRLQHAFQEFGISLSRKDALSFQHTYASYQTKISMTDQMKSCLDDLKKSGIFLGVISNGTVEHQMDKINSLNLTKWIPEQHIIISGGCDFSKPDIRIFQYAEAKLQLDHDNTWYIGDTYKNDIEAPSAFGWHTVWYNHRGYRLEGNKPAPDFTVSSEEELTDLLAKLAILD